MGAVSKTRLLRALGALAVASAFPAFALAYDPLPYTTRTKGFAGWSPTVRGDIRTIGMAGAVVGLADTWIASVLNPAGLAMTVENVNLSFSGNRIHDGDLQTWAEPVSTHGFGAIANPYPWGFALTRWTPHWEGQRYLIPGRTEPILAEVGVQEVRASAARLFLDDRLSLGGSFIFGRAIRDLSNGDPLALEGFSATYRAGLMLGALYQFPHRWLLGLSYQFPMIYAGSPEPTAPVNGFNQPVQAPALLSLGIGWIPNRVFRMGFGLTQIGKSEAISQLRDESRVIGRTVTYQPRVGIAYTALEFSKLKAHVMAGAYYEASRIESIMGRLHWTAGLDLNVWIMNFGWGVDRARDYSDFIYSAGVDLVRVMRVLDLIPPQELPPMKGFLPSPTIRSEVGLPAPLVRDRQKSQQKEDIIEIGRKIPERLNEKMKQTGEGIREMLDLAPSPSPSPSPSPQVDPPAPKAHPKATPKRNPSAAKPKPKRLKKRKKR